MISFRRVVLVHFALCVLLVARLEAIGMVPRKINKVRSQPLPLCSWHTGLIATSLSASVLNVSHGWTSGLGQKAVLSVYICRRAVCGFVFLQKSLQFRYQGARLVDLVGALPVF